MKYISIVILLISVYSCKSRDSNIKDKIHECVINVIDKDGVENDMQSLDTFSILKEIEVIICEKVTFTHENKKRYQELIKLIKNNELNQSDILSKIRLICIKNNFNIDSKLYKYQECLNVILIKNKIDLLSTLHLTTSYLNGIQSDGFSLDNFEIFINNFNENDFETFEYRAVLILVLYTMMESNAANSPS